MFLIDKGKNRVSRLKKKSFQELGFKERDNLQEWIVNDQKFFGEDLLIIQKEFDGFDDTKERIDILALDKIGNMVVIENKLDDSGRDVMWQVLKYASYCASLSKMQIRNIYQKYLDKFGFQESAESNIAEFLDISDFEEIEVNKSQRIIMVSGNFRKEVTTTVLWLLNNYKLKIQCFKVSPYTLDDQLFLNVDQIIPIKEVEEYLIKIAEKKQEDSDIQDELKSRHKTRLEFWRQLLDKLNNSETNLYQNINPSKDSWLSAGVGMSGAGLNVVASKSYARVEVYLSRNQAEENKFIFDELYKQKQQIETLFEYSLIWERLNDKKGCRIKSELVGVSIYEKADWNKMIDFMVDSVIRMEKAIVPQLSKINIKLKKGLFAEQD